MPNLPISQLPSASALTGAEIFPLVQGGVTKQTTLGAITYIPGNSYGLFTQTGSSTPVAATTASGSLLGAGAGSLSVPANGFRVGDAFQASLSGKLSAQNNDTLQILVKSNGVILSDTGTMSMSGVTSKSWRLDIDFAIHKTGAAGVAEISTAGVFQYRQNASTNLVGEIFTSINSSSFDTTITNTLVITAQWSSNNANNSIYSEFFLLKKVY